MNMNITYVKKLTTMSFWFTFLQFKCKLLIKISLFLDAYAFLETIYSICAFSRTISLICMFLGASCLIYVSLEVIYFICLYLTDIISMKTRVMRNARLPLQYKL